MTETETKTPLEQNSDAIAEIMTLANNLPSAGGSTDISLGVTGAAVGDIVKVKAVDADGKPTEWENYFPGYRLLCTQTLEEEAFKIQWTKDIGGNAFDLTGVGDMILVMTCPSDFTSDNLWFFLIGDGYSFANGDVFRQCVVHYSFFPNGVLKQSLVFKQATYMWQNSSPVRKQYWTSANRTDYLHPSNISMQNGGGAKNFPVGTIASVYVR